MSCQASKPFQSLLFKMFCHLESSTNTPAAQSESHVHIKPFPTSLTAYKGHKTSSNVISSCFKAPLQSQNDLWGPCAHDQQTLNI